MSRRSAGDDICWPTPRRLRSPQGGHGGPAVVSPQIESVGRVKDRFTREMLQDIIPLLIEKNYRVFPNLENLASLGLSMVSIETLNIGLHDGLAVIDKLKQAGVKIETMESPAGHEWANWRTYLHEIAPKLLRPHLHQHPNSH